MRAIRPSPVHAALRLALPLVLAGAVLPVHLGAQGPAPTAAGATPVAAGTTVRISAAPPIGSREGRLVADDGHAFVLQSASGSRTRLDTVPRRAVERLEVRRSGGAGRVIGLALVGGLLGAGVGALATQGSINSDGTPPVALFIGVPTGFVVGAVAGGVAGARTGHHWKHVPLPAPSGP
jgi:hypothetical protein